MSRFPMVSVHIRPVFQFSHSDDEVKLYQKAVERENYDNLADLYSIVVCMEHLEKAYIRDSIPASEYTPTCAKLIAQYKTAMSLLSGSVPDLDQFMQTYNLSCQAAANRLKIGVPATIEHATASEHDPTKSAKYVAEAVQHFITLMDSLKLNMMAVDQIHPFLSDLMQSLNKVTILPADFEGKIKIKQWLVTLNKLKASEEISEDQARQLMFDLETAHSAFYRLLSDK